MQSELEAAIKVEAEFQVVITSLNGKNNDQEAAWVAKYETLSIDSAAQVTALLDKVIISFAVAYVYLH